MLKLSDDSEAIITDTKNVVKTLKSLCLEMDQRYDLLKKAEDLPQSESKAWPGCT